jgi:hypothetical protein
MYALILSLLLGDTSGLHSSVTLYPTEQACIEAEKAIELKGYEHPFNGIVRCLPVSKR